MVKTVLRGAAYGLGLSIAAWSFAAQAEITESRKAWLTHLLEQDCGSCHGMTRKGGLGSPLLPEVLRERDDDTLVTIILDGIPGTPMPPWRPLMNAEEAQWLVDLLRKGKK